MAFNLRAVLSLDGNQFINGMNRVNRAMTSPLRAITSMTSSLNGLVGAFAAAASARKIFDETIGQAAKYEQSTITISAMLNDKDLGAQYMKLVDKFAIDSPIMDSQSMLANSKSFLTQSHDMKQLEKMWSLAERMAAIDPYQGVEGAVFALRELFSGDAISIVRRFEMPKKVMNKIKNLDLDEQLEALDKYFNQIGMTQRLIDDMGGTTLGIWAQIKEQVAVIMRDMGAPALKTIKGFLIGINDGLRTGSMSGFQETGAKILNSVATGFVQAATGIGKWIQSIQQNADFQKQTTLFGKVKWVIGDVYENFIEWLDGGGRDKIANTVSDMIQILTASVEASTASIIPIGVKIGSGIFEGIASGLRSQLSESWIAQLLSDPVGFAIKKATFGKVDPIKETQEVREKLALSDAERKGKSQPKIRTTGNIPKRNGGLDRVPYNGAIYSLHKDEMVLPRGEAVEYRNGKKSGGTVNISLNYQGTGNTEQDARKLIDIMARIIEQEGAQMA